MSGPASLPLQHPAKQAVGPHTGHSREDKEAQDLQQDQSNALPAAGQTADQSQRHKTQHIVDQGCCQNGVAHLRFQLTHLLQGLHRDADGGRRKDRTHKYIFQHTVALDQACGGSAPCQSRTHEQGHDHTQQSHPEASLAAVLQFVDVRSHTGGEHQHDDAQFAELGNKFSFCQNIQSRRAKDQARQQSAHYLRHLKPLCQKAQQLRT